MQRVAPLRRRRVTGVLGSRTRSQRASDLYYRWTVSGGAVIHRVVPGKLVLTRSQCDGPITVRAAINSGGADVVAGSTIRVNEPPQDPRVRHQPEPDEKPVDNQFYPRDDNAEGTLYANGPGVRNGCCSATKASRR